MRCNGFRPLAGFWFLNDFKATVNDKSVSRFRPLAGFWFLNGAAFHRRAGFLICFRPLAGFWFLNVSPRLDGTVQGWEVSVPLRGSGS